MAGPRAALLRTAALLRCTPHPSVQSMEIETRSFQMQLNLSQILVEPAIHHAQVQGEEPPQLKHSSPPTIVNHIL
jgi:hypothetical protein